MSAAVVVGHFWRSKQIASTADTLSSRPATQGAAFRRALTSTPRALAVTAIIVAIATIPYIMRNWAPEPIQRISSNSLLGLVEMALLFILTWVGEYALRFVVLEHQSPLKALRSGLRLFLNGRNETAGLFATSTALYGVVFLVLLGAWVAYLLVNKESAPTWLTLSVAAPVAAVTIPVIESLVSASWTEAYMQLRSSESKKSVSNSASVVA